MTSELHTEVIGDYVYTVVACPTDRFPDRVGINWLTVLGDRQGTVGGIFLNQDAAMQQLRRISGA